MSRRIKSARMFSGEGEEREEEPVDVVSGMLVDGGYYRARIATLPPFDMLVGGLLRRGPSVIVPPPFSFIWRIPIVTINVSDE